LFKKRAQAVELRVPEFLVALQPLEGAFQRTALQLTAHHAACLSPLDEPRIMQNPEMLDESRQRHAEWLGQLTHRALAVPELREDGTPSGIGERAEDGVQPVGRIVNHKVKYVCESGSCQAMPPPHIE
jgi:hypothetical protein